MKKYREVNIELDNHYFKTINLSQFIGYEVKLLNQENTLDCIRFLEYLIDYCIDHKPVIKPDQTLAYHSWSVQLSKSADAYLTIKETSTDGNSYIEGINFSSKTIKEQEEICKKFNVNPVYPQFNQLIVISKGVFEGLDIEAVRYSSPDHMTGWWLTTELYDEDINSLITVHYYHVAFNRPDIIKYLALPYGFRFENSISDIDIWFDENAID